MVSKINIKKILKIILVLLSVMLLFGIVSAAAPTANFNMNISTGQTPLTILFTDTSTDSPDNWNWTFGAANFSNSQNPIYTFDGVGIYSVVLNASNVDGFNITTKYVNATNILVSNFTSNATEGTTPTSIQFNDVSTGTPTEWAWFFGDEPYNQGWNRITANAGWTGRYGLSSISLPNGSIIITGGYDGIGSSYRNDVWMSVDGGNVWTLINASAGWAPREGHQTVIMSDGTILVMGGTTTTAYMNDVWRSNDEGKTWTQVNASVAWGTRCEFGAFALNDNSVVVFGGGGSAIKNDTWRSTDGGNTWTLQTASAGWTIRQRFASALLPDGSLIMMGGSDGSGIYNDTWRSTDKGVTWTQMNASSGWTRRIFATSVGMPDNSIVLMGGLSSVRNNDTWRSADGGRTWLRLNASSGWTARNAHTSIVTYNGSVLLMGGYDNTYKNDTWKFNPVGSLSQNPIHTYSPVLSTRFYNVSLQTYNKLNYNNTIKLNYINVTPPAPVANFIMSSISGPTPLYVNFTDVSIYIPTSWNWTFGAANFSNAQNPNYLFDGPGNYSVTLTASNTYGCNSITKYVNVSPPYPLAAFSSNATSGNIPLPILFTDNSLNDPAGWSWLFGDENWTKPVWTRLNASSGWKARYVHFTVTLPDGSIVLMGGTDGTTRLNDTWRSTDNGITWVLMNSSSGWSGRSSASVIVSQDGSIILMGGYDGTNRLNDVWRSNDKGLTWSLINSSSEWSPRNSHNSVIMGDGSIVLMGGDTGTIRLNDTWKSTDNGKIWTRLNASSGWQPRSYFTASRLSDDSIVIVGGFQSTGSVRYNDAWLSIDGGNAWNKVNSSVFASGRYRHSAVVMPDNSIVITGGTDTADRNNVWRSTDKGNLWTQINASAGWAVRGYHSSTVISNGSIILTGGDGAATYNDTWMFNPMSSFDQNPTHTYTTNGTFNVSLQVYNAFGYNNTIKENYINTITPVINPIADFTSNITIYNMYPMIVQFNDTSIGYSLTTWNWSFGDGRWFNTTSSSLKNATYAYAVAGKYNVSLSVSNLTGTNTITKTNYINLTSDNDANVTSWMHMNGTNGSTVFNDERGLAWATNGNARISTLRPKYGGASGYFDGSGDYISTPNSSAVAFGTGDFTIEFWMNVTTIAGANEHVFSKTTNTRSRGWGMDRTDTAKGDSGWDFWMGNDTVGQVFFNAPIPTKTWNHIAIERKSGTIYLYINGNLTNSSSGFNANYDTTDPLWVGRQGTNYYDGYVDEFRISKSLARWNANFTPPYNQYAGTLETIYPDINPNSTMRYKTNPDGNASITNKTPRNRTIQIENVYNTSYVIGTATFDPLYFYCKAVGLNETYFPTGMTLISSNIDNTLGEVSFNISRPAGFNAGTNRASIIDYELVYWKYANPESIQDFFGYGYLLNGTTFKIYPIHNFIPTNVTLLSWDINVNFTANTTITRVGVPVNFTDDSYLYGSYPDAWNWSFGDGYIDNDTNQTILHTYSTTGYKNITLTAYLSENYSVYNQTTKIFYINVVDAPIANFTMSNVTGPSPLLVNFTDTSENLPTSWNWTFGAANFSDAQYPNFTFVGDSNYSVTLNASNAYGFNSTTKYVNVSSIVTPPVANFTMSNTTGVTPLLVNFTDTSTNTPTSWNWTFGAANFSDAQYPNFTFVGKGNYSVVLNASNAGGFNTTTKYVNVSSGMIAPIADFTMSNTTGISPLLVNFTDTSTNTPTSWNWTFGAANFSNAQYPNYIFVGDSVYPVTLNVSNIEGFNSTTKYVTVSSSIVPLIANFTSDVTSGPAPLSVSFTDTSTDSPTGWSWFFGDETYNQTWTLQNSSSGWSGRFGLISVTLPNGDILIMGGNDGGLKNDVWKSTDDGVTWTLVNSSSGWVVREFPSSVVLPDKSILVLGGSGTTAYQNDVWRSTNDGVIWTRINSSAGWVPRKEFGSVVLPDGSIVVFGGAGAGIYNDTWRSTDNGVMWVQQNASSGWAARSGFTSSVLQNGDIIMTGGYSTTLLNDVWKSTDKGITWSQVTASAEWSARRYHTLNTMPDNSLVLQGGLGSSRYNDTWRSTDGGVTWTQLKSSNAWTARNAHTSTLLQNGNVLLMGGYDGAYKNDTWIFNPVGSSSQNPSHIFSSIGFYNVSLRVYNSVNYNTTIKTNYIYATPQPPVADFTMSNTTGPSPLKVNFTDTSTNTPTSWNWTFGAANFSNAQYPNYMFIGASNYSVTLNASNGGGFSIKTKYVNVTPAPPIANFTANITTGTAPLTVQFTDTSINNPTGWAWLFGDENWTIPAWTQINASAEWSGRYTHNSIIMPDGSVILIGGYTGSVRLNDTWRSTDGGNTWTQIGSNPGWVGKSSASVVIMTDGGLILTGGFDGIARYNDVWRSADSGATWTLMNASAGWVGRSGHTTVAMPDGSIVLMGGQSATSTFRNDTWRSTDNGATWTQMNSSSGWETRYYHKAVSFSDNSIVLTGGVKTGSPYYNDSWISTNNGATWMRMNISSGGLPGRAGFVSVVMPDNSIVLMGGTDGSNQRDVWRSADKGSSWSQINVSAGWSIRQFFSGVVMPNGSIIIMGGNGASPTAKNDVWMIDPMSSFDQNPIHTYTTPGKYNVSLKAYNNIGFDSISKVEYITVIPSTNPVASFTSNITYGSSPLPVQFTDTSTNTTSWNWSFQNITGNNTEIWFSTSQNPLQIFNVGNFSIKLNASNNIGYNITPDIYFINVSEAITLPVANFTSDVTSGTSPLSVTFTDTSTYATSWNWSFQNVTGNNTEIWFSTSQNPLQVFNVGNFSIKLNASNSMGSNITPGLYFINVSEAPLKPIANFTSDVTSGYPPLTVSFTDTSINSPTGWSWFFGDETYTQSWNQINSSAGWVGRYGATSVTLQDGTILTMGGNDGTYKNDVWKSIDNGITWSQLNASAGWVAREYATSVVLQDGSILIMGGTSSTAYMNDVWRSTDNGKIWTQINSTAWSVGRTAHTSVVMGDGSVIVMGGGGAANKNDTWRSTDNGVTWVQMNPSSGWTARYGHTSIVLTDGSLILMAGNDGSIKNDVWRSTDNGATWSQITPNAAWSGRFYLTSIAMPDNSIVVMGGLSGTRNNDTWRSTNRGLTWTQLSSSAGWTARNAQTSVLTQDGSIILMGGYDNTYKNDVWKFSPVGSILQNPSHIYSLPGKYNVSLQVYNNIGFNNTRKVEYINVIVPAPIANFTANITYGESPLVVNFIDQSTGFPTSWAWDVENDGVNESYTQNYIHTYLIGGLYTVKLTVNNTNTSDVAIKINYITVLPPTPPMGVTNLTATELSCHTINFTWTNPSEPDFLFTQIWFNNGYVANTSSDYFLAGGLSDNASYTISTRTIDTFGHMNMTWVNLTYYLAACPVPPATLRANFTITQPSVCIPSNVILTNDSYSLFGITNFYWNVSNGGTGVDFTTDVVNFNYITDSVFTINFTIKDTTGNTSTKFGTVYTVNCSIPTPTPTPTRVPGNISQPQIPTQGAGNYTDIRVWLIMLIGCLTTMVLSRDTTFRTLRPAIFGMISFIFAIATLWFSLSIAYVGNFDVGAIVQYTNQSSQQIYYYQVIQVVASPVITMICLVILIFIVLNMIDIGMNYMQRGEILEAESTERKREKFGDKIRSVGGVIRKNQTKGRIKK